MERNAQQIICQRCKSLIFNKNVAELCTKEKFLPYMKKKCETQTEDEGETVRACLRVHDMYEFENVGFSKPVGTVKYLICADCDAGPIGWHDSSKKLVMDDGTEKLCFYIAIDRIKYKETETEK